MLDETFWFGIAAFVVWLIAVAFIVGVLREGKKDDVRTVASALGVSEPEAEAIFEESELSEQQRVLALGGCGWPCANCGGLGCHPGGQGCSEEGACECDAALRRDVRGDD